MSSLDPANLSPRDGGRTLPLGDLLALGSHIRADNTPESLLREVAETLQRVVNSPQVYVRLRNVDTDDLEAIAFAGVPPGHAHSLIAEPVQPSRYQPLLRPERRVSDSYVLPPNTALPADADANAAPTDSSTLLVPLRGRGDRLLGVIVIALPPDAPPLELTAAYVIEAIARQAALAVENVRLAERSARLLANEQLLAQLGRDVSATLDLDTILARTVERLAAAFGSGSLALLQPDGDLEVLAAMPAEAHLIGARFRQNGGIFGWVIQQGRSYLANTMHADTDFPPLDPAAQSCIVTPLRSGGQVIGALAVGSPQPHAFAYEDVDLIEAIAAQVGGPITSARLYRRAQGAAVLEERNRLARELHDSVTQQLFSMVLTAQAARAQLERNPQRAAAQLERLQETASAALAEMRALIFQLRPPALQDQGLVAALQQHALSVSRREGLAVTLNVAGDERLAQGIEQPLFRIVQEALNNVFKHANARNVAVSLEFGNDLVRVRVSDDGQGFDPAAAPSGGGRQIGLLSMRERAAEIGGMMELRSSIGGGTEVVVTVPRPGQG